MRGRPLRQTEHPDSVDHAREAALKILARAPQLSIEVRERLKGQGFAEGCVDEVVSRLTDVGLIDDDDYAEMFVRDRRDRVCRSRRAIMFDLGTRGLSPEAITRAIAQYPPEQELVVATAFAARKLGSRVSTAALDDDHLAGQQKYASTAQDGSNSQKEFRRVYAALARRGFNDSVSRSAIYAALNPHNSFD